METRVGASAVLDDVDEGTWMKRLIVEFRIEVEDDVTPTDVINDVQNELGASTYCAEYEYIMVTLDNE